MSSTIQGKAALEVDHKHLQVSGTTANDTHRSLKGIGRGSTLGIV